MKEIYAWVPWFKALTDKIAEGGEEYLAARAKEVYWGNSRALLEYEDENIDPFSFIYFLASKNTSNQRIPVFQSVGKVFGVNSKDDIFGEIFSESSLEYGFWFPKPPSQGRQLFHDGKGNGDPSLMWELFRQAASGREAIDADLFSRALEIRQVGVAKITQCLFLINPTEFMPVDPGIFECHKALGLPSWRDAQQSIEQQGGWKNYQAMVEIFESIFLGCSFYEINTAIFVMNRWKGKGTNIARQVFQVSTNVYNDGDDYWSEFSANNHVRTGGPDRKYGLEAPSKGDIVLVRTGVSKGRAIGVVYQNEYVDGWGEEKAVHVLWLNKLSAQLSQQTVRLGFSSAQMGTFKAFYNTGEYEKTFKFLKGLRPPDNGNGLNEVETMFLNQIFYGPPGTGKTYRTVPVAVEILDPVCYKENANYRENRQCWENLKDRFDELREGGQVSFVTFHQSFGYEEFVEGIRPTLDGEQAGEVSFEMGVGVFKDIAKKARKNLEASLQTEDEPDFDALIDEFTDTVAQRVESEEGGFLLFGEKYSHVSRSSAKVVGIKRDAREDPRSFVVELGDGKWQRSLTLELLRRDYPRFRRGEISSAKDIPPTTRNSTRRWHSKGLYLLGMLHRIAAFEKESAPSVREVTRLKNYVLVIDEINRGNISRIFGELITLIEESKRVSNDSEEAIEVILPYSGETFGVPKNLYIIGTMNTADRSIALLDTALRRRFRFTEMMPEPELLADITVDGIEIEKLLAEMNERIEAFYDRDHQIGHSFFMQLKDKEKRNIKTLADIFEHEVLPLLQEYFYGDWEKIDQVLNNNGFLLEKKLRKNLRDVVGDDKKIWKINPSVFEAPEKHVDRFRAIYDDAARDGLPKNENSGGATSGG